MITNLETDPNGFKWRYQWGCHTVRREDGHCMYVGTGNTYMGACSRELSEAAPVGHVIVLVAQTPDTAFTTARIWAADELLNEQDGDTYIKAARITETNRIHELTISSCTTGVTILASALYAPDDWDEILGLYNSGVLKYPWIAGESLPLGGYVLLTAIHTPSGWRWRRDSESVCNAIRVSEDDIHMECGKTSGCANRKMGVSMPTGRPLRGNLPFQYGVCAVQGRRCARLHLFMRCARQTMFAQKSHHSAHNEYGHYRGCGAHGSNGMGRWSHLGSGWSARIVDLPRMRLGHVGRMRSLRSKGLARRAEYGLCWCIGHPMVCDASGAKRHGASTCALAVAASRLEVAA